MPESRAPARLSNKKSGIRIRQFVTSTQVLQLLAPSNGEKDCKVFWGPETKGRSNSQISGPSLICRGIHPGKLQSSSSQARKVGKSSNDKAPRKSGLVL
ncbi:hypothetical protein NPIL_156391 [Nephila pilipes]|uniref:Uncharacterized protein n=1 Tax=Nephila pilipes TaxID=299642 RepID=A0A8X6PR96_NEPPI|nr:hypothetical protein NPIL_156391 [Nephila pilipes]